MKPGAIEAASPSDTIAALVASVGAGPCAVFSAEDEVMWANPPAMALLGDFGKGAFGAVADRRCAMATGRAARRRIEIGEERPRRTFVIRFAPVPGERDRVFCALIDVTGEARAMKTLREVTQRANEFVSLVSDCVWETDPSWRLTHFSLRDANSGSSRDLIGRSLFEIGCFAASGGVRPPSPRLRALFRGAPFRIRFGAAERTLILTGMPLFDEESGAFLGFRGAGEDATSRLRAEDAEARARADLLSTLETLSLRNRELDKALVDAQAADAAKDQFLARMSHELRTPLNAVLGLSSLLHATAADRLAPTEMRFVEEIGNAGRHLLALVEDVLEYSRSRVGRVALRREPLDLGGVAIEASAFIRQAAGERGVSVVIDAEPGLAMNGDPTRLRQVFINLLDNALKFSPEGGAITVTARREGERFRASVQDEGPGVPPELLERVFDPFFQADDGANRSHGGVGLGLALCRQFVTWHEGDIRFREAPGGGALVEIVLPAYSGSATST